MRKNSVLSVSLAVATALTLSSCSGPASPLCDDPTVLELTDDIIRNYLVRQHTGVPGGFDSPGYRELLEDAQQEPSPETLADRYPPTFFDDEKQRNELIQKDEAERKLRAAFLLQLPDVIGAAEVTPSVIRTQEINDQIRKSSCLAHFNMNYGNPDNGEQLALEGDFAYTAQYTDDGAEIYVEGGFL